MADSIKALTAAEAGARKAQKAGISRSNSGSRFPPGLEWEVMQADATILLGLTQALSESYLGYVQCL